MKKEIRNPEEMMMEVPAIGAGEDFYAGVEARINFRLAERQQFRNRLKHAGNVLLILLAIVLNTITIGLGYRYLQPDLEETSTESQVYFYDPSQQQLASLLNQER